MKYSKENKDLFLFKLFSVNSVGVIIRSFLGLLSQKLIAIYLGPEGIAYIGNLRNALSVFSLGATAGVDQGVLKYQSELNDNPEELKKLYSTSLAFILVGSVTISLLLLFGSSFWSQYLFKTPQFSYLFIILGFTIPFAAIYNLCFAIISGQSNYVKATLISLITAGSVTILVIFLVFFCQLSGVLLAITLTPIIQLLVLFIFARKEIDLFRNLKIHFHRIITNNLLVFIVMSVVAVVFSNLVDIELRSYLITKLSVKEAGYWTSMLNLSNYYLSFMTGVYSLYVLPRYAKIKDIKTFLKEIMLIYKVILPIFVVLFIAIFLLRDFIIAILYTRDFLPMGVLFKWQLLGDMVKITSVILAYQLIAQKLWKLYILTEIISVLTLYVFGTYFIDRMGVQGITYAHFLRYIVYLIVVIVSILFANKNKIKNEVI
ncbi:O-antigen translocase [Mariniflexile aquimaris]|uniref:O-antigen translocase n=1 Tax=Mariniflexile aquimaris TaxID=881009 RepID=A0ABW3BWD1_9FLAO